MVEFAFQSIVSPVLIGRAPQLAALDIFIQNAHLGHGQVVVLAGEAGVGKSRLVTETQARFLSSTPQRAGLNGEGVGLRTLIGHCFENDHALPYAPMLDLLRHIVGAGSLEEFASSLGPAISDLAVLLPELSDLAPPSPHHSTLDPAQEKHRLFQALGRALLRPATPQVVVIEDLHWCDDTSLEFLLYLARRVAHHPTLLLLTYRSDEVHPALRHFLAALDRERLIAELPLSGLARDEVDALIRAIFPQRTPVRAEFLDVLYALTEGNPFFLEEILKSLLASGDIFYQDGRWTRKPLAALTLPRTVQDSVQRRSEQVSPAARRVLTLISVAGQRFDFALLQQVTGQSESDLLALLKELISVQLLVEESDERFAFRHALTRQAIYAGLLTRERRALHNVIAQAIVQQNSVPLEARVSELAYHFYEAGAWEEALLYAQHAGEQAQGLYALQAAAEQFSRAIEASQRLNRATAFGLYRARGGAYESLGDFDAAQADYLCALHASRQAGEQHDEWQSLFDLGFLWTGRDFEQASVYLEGALSLARAIGDPATLAHSLNRVGNWCANREQPQEARRRHEEALHLFEDLGDRSGQAATLDLLGISSLMGGNMLASAAYYERAVALFRALSDQQGLALALGPFSLCGGSYMSPSLVSPSASADACRSDAEEAVALMRQTGSRVGEAFSLMYMALALGARGDYARAWRAASQCITLSEEIEHPITLAGGHFALGALYLDLLMPEAARQHTQVALDLSLKTGSPFLIGSASSFHALACMGQRDYVEAASVLDAVAAPDRDAPADTVPQRLVAGARVALALARGEPGSALAMLDALVASAVRDAPGSVVPALWHWRGRALAALGDTGAAISVLEIAGEAARLQELPPILWRIHLDLGNLYQARGERLRASACWDAARALIAELGERLPDQDLRSDFLTRAAALLPAPPTPTARQAARQASGGLTAREAEVAALIAQGKSNRDIAAALFLSQRTVQVHITNILSKLNFQSRTQIAAWVTSSKFNVSPKSKVQSPKHQKESLHPLRSFASLRLNRLSSPLSFEL